MRYRSKKNCFKSKRLYRNLPKWINIIFGKETVRKTSMKIPAESALGK